jgi:hypothetical protein
MHTIELITVDGKSIYRGQHNSLNDAIESAIQKNIPLDGINLSFADLHHINLDGVSIKNASFQSANLGGANMSECNFSDCDFSSANLEDACLCYSNLNNCNFKLCEFKEADISMSSITNCAFEGFSTFYLRLHSAFKILNLTYHHFTKQYPINTPPTLIQSGDKMIALLDNSMICKGIQHTFEYGSIPENTPEPLTQAIQSIIDSKGKNT